MKTASIVLPLTVMFLACISETSFAGDSVREKILINNGWSFSLGYAGDMQKDFTHGTEYFTYVTKTKSNNGDNSPSNPDFDDSAWQ